MNRVPCVGARARTAVKVAREDGLLHRVVRAALVRGQEGLDESRRERAVVSVRGEEGAGDARGLRAGP